MPQKADNPNIPWRDFPHQSVVLDTLIRERTAAFAGDTGPVWKPIEPGTPYRDAVQHSESDGRLYKDSVFLGQKLGQDRTFYELFYASSPQTQDVYNYSVSYSGKANTTPIFKRLYLELRDTYQSRADLSPLTGIYAIQVGSSGAGYVDPIVTITDSGSGTGATAIAIADKRTGAIVKITVKSEGVNYTAQTVTIAITDGSGPGSGASGIVILQPANCLLIDEEAAAAPDPYGSLYLMVKRTYETLPGPIFASIVPDAELGIPVMTTEQRRASTDTWACGEIAPILFGVMSATIAEQTTVTLTASGFQSYPAIQDIYVGEWVVIDGTSGFTPSLDGTWQVVATNGNQITINLSVTGLGIEGGTMSRYSYAYVERRQTENSNVVLLVTTRAAVQDITALNESTIAYRPYPFPDALLAIYFYTDLSSGSSASASSYSYSHSFSGSVGFDRISGFRGACKATRLRVFSMGPIAGIPTNPTTSLPYTPTVVMGAAGTVTTEGGAKSFSQNALSALTQSKSVSFKGTEVPYTLQAPTFSGGITPVGSGDSTATLNLVPSVVKDAGSASRPYFLQGDIITEIDPPEKMRATGVYMTTIWLIVAPYTTGLGPDDFIYSTDPATYPASSPIAANTPVISGTASGFTVSPTLPLGLSISSSTGHITGTPTTVTPQAYYTVKATLNGVVQRAIVSIEIT